MLAPIVLNATPCSRARAMIALASSDAEASAALKEVRDCAMSKRQWWIERERRRRSATVYFWWRVWASWVEGVSGGEI
jgi:hypothetical protein